MEEPDTVGVGPGRHTNALTRAATDLPPKPSHENQPAPLMSRRAVTSVTLKARGPAIGLKQTGGARGATVVKLAARKKTAKKVARPRRPLTPTESVSDGYFSDSDDEDKRRGCTPVTGRSSTDFILDICNQVYNKSCKTLKIVPRQHFLKQLKKRNVSMRNEGLSRKELNAVCASLVSFEKLFSLDLSGNLLTTRCVGYVCQLLDRNTYITDLALSECDLSLDGLTELVNVIPRISTLQSLDLSGNKFRDNTGEMLSHLIMQSQDLSRLVLSHNELREKGGIYIGDALAKNDSLEVLDLSWNHLRGQGADCVALALLTNKMLTYLDLSWNGFGFEGCCALGHSLHNNTTLKEIDLTCNRIHPSALYELLKGVLCNRGLTCLRLGRNPIPAAMMGAILSKFRDAWEMPLVTLDFTGIIVDMLFEVVLEEIQESRPYFECLYERSLPIHQEKWEDLDKLHKGVLNIDPMRILFFSKKNLRIIDLFRQMDKDHSASISREEIKKALLKEQLPVSSSSLDAIMDYLDANNDGEVNLMELTDGERRFKRDMIAQKQEWQAQERLNIQKAQKDGLPTDLGGAGSRFSRSFRPDLVDLEGQSNEYKGKISKKPATGKFISEELKLPSINDRPGNIIEKNAWGVSTERNTRPEKDISTDNLPNTIR